MLQERLATNRWFTSTLQQLFVETCRERPERTAIVFQEEPITFEEVQESVNRLSQALIDLGVRPGDHVASLPTSSPEFAYLYFATLQIGALINPLNHEIPKEFLEWKGPWPMTAEGKMDLRRLQKHVEERLAGE